MPTEITHRQRVLAVLLGLACHVAFGFAVWKMFWGIESGMSGGRGSLTGLWALAANCALLFQFVVLHSFLLSKIGRRLLAKLGGTRGNELTTTLFTLVASVQLIAVFELWSPSGIEIFHYHTEGQVAALVLYVSSWLLLGRAMYDAGFQLQTGMLGWWAISRGRRPSYPPMPTTGTFRLVRHPIYLAFALILWTSPSGTLDHLLMAALWTIYLVFGPMLKERRFEEFFGDTFRAYKARTPYFFPVRRR
ncbi:MAG: isoprenylcysteine carboxylmethyltransferase family protein [Deltaproteobacteria bacterium]|nr:isoprenylcysteine carboxylmethyltransferase family protein [Deltaproteobacteria bacterium]